MMEVIQAEESRDRATEVGVGSSFKPGAWASRQMRHWGRIAAEGVRQKATPGTPVELAAIGIGVRRRG